MQFSTVLLAAAAGLVSAKQFTIVAIRSGTDIQNAPVYSNGEKLVIGGKYQATQYEVKDMLLLANGKPIEFGDGAKVVDSESAGTRDIEVNGQNHIYVPRYTWTACPAEGEDYLYTIENVNVCGDAGLSFAPRVMWTDAEESKPVETESKPVESKPVETESKVPAATITPAPVPVPTGGSVVTANSTIVLTVTDCGDNTECVPNKPKPTQVEPEATTPEQANGAAAFGVSVAAAGLAAAALLF